MENSDGLRLNGGVAAGYRAGTPSVSGTAAGGGEGQRNPFGGLKSRRDALGRRAVTIAGPLVWIVAPFALTIDMTGTVSAFKGVCVGNRELK